MTREQIRTYAEYRLLAVDRTTGELTHREEAVWIAAEMFAWLNLRDVTLDNVCDAEQIVTISYPGADYLKPPYENWGEELV